MFSDKGKETSVLRSPFFVNIFIYAAVSNGKRKNGQFSLIRLPFAHRANVSLSFVDEGTNESYPVCIRTKQAVQAYIGLFIMLQKDEKA